MHCIDYLTTLVCMCLWTDRLTNDHVRISIPVFTKFCIRLSNVVGSTSIVSATNQKWIYDFRSVQIPILAVSWL